MSLPRILAALALAGALIAAPQGKSAPPEAKKAAAAKAAPAASDADIAAAKAKGLVWVNTNTGVYHKDGRYYGKTKQGQFMTEDEAKKAGHHAAKEGAVHKKDPAATPKSGAKK